MITADSLHVDSHRSVSLWKKFRNKKYRDGYVSSHIKKFLAHQITALRGDKSQTEFGEIIGKPQSVVCRLENPYYGKYALQTLLDVASKLNLALIVRFVDFSTFLTDTSDFSDEAVRPRSYEQAVEEAQFVGLDKEEKGKVSPVVNTTIMPGTGSLNATGYAPEVNASQAGTTGSAPGMSALTTGVRGGMHDAVESSSVQTKLGKPQFEMFDKAANQGRIERMPKAA